MERSPIINSSASDERGIRMLDTLTEAEAVAIAEAMAAGALDASDNRSDGAQDHDPLGDDLRVGRRIAEGFQILKGESI